MGRKGSKEEYLNIIRKLRNAIPNIALRTTLIAGFPSETEKEFESLVDFVKKTRFDRLGVFKYSREEGTPAAKLKGHISDKTKTERLEAIMKCQSYISLEKNKMLIGKKFRAIIDNIEGSTAIGRLYSHTPEIDGVVMIEHSFNTCRLGDSPPHSGGFAEENEARTPQPCVGDFVNVKITEALDYDLKGTIIL
jgi:ribosomal protein S12 methylthiotransferase